MSLVRSIAFAGLCLGAASCSSAPATPDLGAGTFHVHIDSVNGNTTLPTAASPLPPNLGVTPEAWAFSIEARSPTGDLVTSFNGYVRLTVVPGTIISIASTTNTTQGRNILMQNGKASGVVQATGVYGPASLWIEDLGYVPAAHGATPKCSDGIDNNSNGLIDFPADPGCYFADDDTEDGGTYTTGVSPSVQYALPKISDVRGKARTPFPNEAVDIATLDPEWLVVTRVSGSGFFVTDVNPTEMAKGYNSLFAFNFSTPANMQVCDRITQLSGTANDFYGFTQLSFPSYLNTYTVLGTDGGAFNPQNGIPGCKVPEPVVLDPSQALPFSGDKNTTSAALYPYEAGLVRIKGFTIAKNFGSKLAYFNQFGPGTSNCDFNGNGQIDYTSTAPNCPPGQCEGDCSNTCDSDPNCTEWTAYSARSQYKVSWRNPSTQQLSAATMILVNTSTVSTFDPVGNAGATIDAVTGSLTEFSGGTLNWTVEARCPDDVVCPASMGCTVQSTVPTYKACVQARTIDDNDQGTN